MVIIEFMELTQLSKNLDREESANLQCLKEVLDFEIEPMSG